MTGQEWEQPAEPAADGAATKAAWDEVGTEFTRLGVHLKHQIEARLAFAKEQAPEEVEQAIKKIVDTLNDAFGAVGETLRDPTIRDDAKRAASTLGDAVARTLQQAGDEVRSRLGSDDEPPASPGPTAGG